MRVLDCDVCGETIAGANDAELTRRVKNHYEAEHEGLDDEEAEGLVEAEAYDALDS
jgi:predicted small metal-binding protein